MIKKVVKKFIPGFLLSFYHYLIVLTGAVVFGFPGKRIIVIGVTGTSGKSTTVDFIAKILEESGAKVASVSSIRFRIGGKEWKNELKMTMPGRLAMQKFLRQAAKEKCKFAILEVTSEGIRQHRHGFINFDTAVFTNLGPEHIESHGGFENYRNEKLKLFKENQNTHIVSIADDNAEYFWKIPAKNKIGYKFKFQNAKIKTTTQNPKIIEAENVESNNEVLLFKIQGVEFRIPIMGEFNTYNALAAIAVATNYGISLDICKKALEKVSGIPGRMEIIQKEPFSVVVDYAHTPVQLEKVYQTFSEKYKMQDIRLRQGFGGQAITKQIQNFKSQIQNSRLICVLGSCGGGRDKWKRPVLGKIASQYCQEIIITNEDPYDENPSQILSEIKSGISNTQYPISNSREILDRKEAIERAIKLAKPGDTVVITGKGSETLMCLADGKKIPWSDKETVKRALGLDF